MAIKLDVDDPIASGNKVMLDVDDPIVSRPAKATPAPKPRTWGEAGGDFARGLASGVGTLVKTGGDLYGLATGNMDNAASQLGQSVQEYWQEGQSDYLKHAKQERSRKIQESEGVFGQAGTAVKETITNPALFADIVAENATMLIPSGLVGRAAATAAAKAGTAAATKAAMGPITRQAAQEVAKRAGRIGTGAAIGTGAIQQGADVAGGQYERVLDAKQTPQSVWDANPEYTRRVAAGEDAAKVKHDMALSSARKALGAAAAISAVTQYGIPGGASIERALAGISLTRQGTGVVGRAVGAGRAATGEALQEAFEEGGGQIAANWMNRDIDPNTKLGEGVGEAAGLGFVGGLAIGGPAGAMHGSRSKLAAPVDKTWDDEPSATDIESSVRRQMLAQFLDDGTTEINSSALAKAWDVPRNDVQAAAKRVSKSFDPEGMAREQMAELLISDKPQDDTALDIEMLRQSWEPITEDEVTAQARETIDQLNSMFDGTSGQPVIGADGNPLSEEQGIALRDQLVANIGNPQVLADMSGRRLVTEEVSGNDVEAGTAAVAPAGAGDAAGGETVPSGDTQRDGGDIAGSPGPVPDVPTDLAGPGAATNPQPALTLADGSPVPDPSGGVLSRVVNAGVETGAVETAADLSDQEVVAERTPFADPDVEPQRAFTERMRGFGVPEEEIASMLPKVARDDVTGFFDGRASGVKTGTLDRAKAHVEQTGEPAVYVSADIFNLGGLNQHFGDRAADANPHYRAMANILLDALAATGADVVPLRTGGDETGYVAVNVTIEQATEAAALAEAQIAQYAKDNGLDAIENPKRQDERGVGMHIGVSEITAQRSNKEIFDNADDGVNVSKRRYSDVIRGEAAQTGPVSPEGRPGQVASSDPATDERVRGQGGPGQSEDGSTTAVGAPDQGDITPTTDVVMQPRSRDRVASVAQMQSIRHNPDPRRLGFSRDPNTGAPMVSEGVAVPEADKGRADIVIGADGREVAVRYAVVEASELAASHDTDGVLNPDYENAPLQALNNGRTAGLQAAWASGNADRYLEGVVSDAPMHGVSAEAIQSKSAPILVRLYDPSENRNDMGAWSNADQQLGMSPIERAQSDARALPPLHSIQWNADGSVTPSRNMDFFRAWFKNLGSNEAAKLQSDRGEANAFAVQRLRAALAYQAYRDDRLLAALTEEVDPDNRSILNALVRSAPAFASLDQNDRLVHDLRARIIEGVELVRQATRDGIKLDSLLSQMDLLGREGAAETIAQFMGANKRRTAVMADTFTAMAEYVAASQQQAATTDIFGTAQTPAVELAIEAANAALRENYGDEAPQISTQARPGSGNTEPGDRGGEQPSEGQTDEAEQLEPVSGAPEPFTLTGAVVEPQAAPLPQDPQGSLIAPPTSREIVDAEVAKRDAERNGRTGTAPTDMLSGPGNLFAGPMPVQTDIEDVAEKVEAAAAEAATSDLNDKPEPTEAQKNAGNYPKGHVKLHGLDISIENPRGSERSGTDRDGNRWSSTMSDHYGYIKRTEGADGDHVDVYIGPNPESEQVFIVDQLDQQDGSFDEHKVMLGYDSEAEAVAAYRQNFDPGWQVGPVAATDIAGFKTWLKDGNTARPATPQLATIKAGDRVNVTDGKHKGKSGVVTKVNDKTFEIQFDNDRTGRSNKTSVELAPAATSAPDAQPEARAELPILSQTKAQYVRDAVKAERIRKGSPGYAAAVARIEARYEAELDDAHASLSFQQFMARHPGTPEGVARQAWESLRTERGLPIGGTDGQASVSTDVGSVGALGESVAVASDVESQAGEATGTPEIGPKSAAVTTSAGLRGLVRLLGSGDIASVFSGLALDEARALAGALGHQFNSPNATPESIGRAMANNLKTGRQAAARKAALTIYSAHAANHQAANSNPDYFSTDVAKLLFPEYATSTEGARDNNEDVQAAASMIARAAFLERLSQSPKSGDKVVTLMAGGIGSGKSTVAPGAGIVYDTTSLDLDATRENIKAVLDSGRDVSLNYVFNDPETAFRRMLDRGRSIGRVADIGAFVASHSGSHAVVTALQSEFASNKRVTFTLFDNRGDRPVEMATVPDFDYSGLAEGLENVLNEEYRAGRVSPETYRWIAHRAPPTLGPRGTVATDQQGEAEAEQGVPERVEPVGSGDTSGAASTPTRGVKGPKPISARKAGKGAAAIVIDPSATNEQSAADDGALSDAELEALFDEAEAELREESQQATEAATQRAPTQPAQSPAPQGTQSQDTGALMNEEEKTAARLAKEAAKLGMTGVDEAIKGLVKLFGASPGRLNTFPPGFDEDAYKKAKPHFQAMLANLKAAGGTLKELFKYLIQNFGSGIKMYAVQFAKEEGLGRDLDAEQDQGQNVPITESESGDAILGESERVSGRGSKEGEGDGGNIGSDSESVDAGLAAAGEGADRGRGADRAPQGPDQGRTGSVGSDGVRKPSVQSRETASDGNQPESASDGQDAGSRTGSDERVTDPATSETSPSPELDDFNIDADEIGKGGLRQKYKDNLDAIHILKAMRAENRAATPDERKQIAKYVGWGALKGVFDPESRQWGKEHAELKGLLTDAEFAAARASTLNAHYTSPTVVTAMFDALQRMGVTGGARILEPSVGVGNFFGLMPGAMRKSSSLFGVELDPLTSQIAAALYPSARVAQATGFQDFQIPGEYFDVAIGNPPFGSEPIVDPDRSAYSGFSIHNYFFAKSIDKLRPGGLMVMVVSHNFLDAKTGTARKWIAQHADLVDAVRLPNTAFKENAGTEVVTDIIVFRKRGKDEAAGDASWVNTQPITLETEAGTNTQHTIGSWFARHPEKVLGQQAATGSMYRADEYTVTPTGDLQGQLAGWVNGLPQNLYAPVERTHEQESADVVIPDGIKVGSFYLGEDGRVMVRQPDALGRQQSRPWTPDNAKADERMRGMIGLRDALRAQMRMERSPDATERQVETGRKKLGALYDAFNKKYGFINDQVNRRVFRDDPEASLLQALELDYDPGVSKAVADREGIEPRRPSAKKAGILSRRMLFPPGDNMRVTNAKDALLASLNYKGRVDVPYMATLYGKDQDAIVAELGDLVFNDPLHGIVMADEYLSGDVKTKLVEAKAAAQVNPDFKRNVTALEKVIPADKRPSEIHAGMGVAFVPRDIYEAFAREITGGEATIGYIPATAQWSVTIESADPTLNTSTWGTSRVPASDLIEETLRGRVVIVKDTHKNSDGTTTTVLNEPETEAAREKQSALKAEWQAWLWRDPERADRLVTIYNDTMNRTVNRAYDGSHLNLPGKVPDEIITLRSHQTRGVWRALQSRQMLLDQVVGAGKSFEMVAIAMEMRRLGIARKPMIAVPNHLTLQWRNEFAALYPTANVLVAEPSDFQKGNREKFFSKVVTNDWDAIVIGHSSLKKIGLPEETEKRILQEQVNELTLAIEQMKRERGDRHIVRDMEKIRATKEAQFNAKLAAIGKRDKVVTFDELGVDAMMIDELHMFKNLSYHTTMDRVPGMGNPAGSDKAWDLFIKLQWMFDTFGDKANIIGATGTPVSNSIVEMYNMQRYMQYPTLKKEGLHVFDAWAKQFAQTESLYEVSPSGTGYRSSTRFSKFVNLPALMGHYGSFADVVTLDDLKSQEIAQGKVFPVPNIATGRPINVVAQRSPLQAQFMGVTTLALDENGRPQFGVNLSDPRVEVKIEEGTKNMEGKFAAMASLPDGLKVLVGGKWFDTEADARMAVVEAALSPVLTVDPESILGQFENLKQLARETKGKINALSLSGLANKAGLDYRLIDPTAPDFAGSKVNLSIDRMMDAYKKWEADKGTQLVFLDLSTPKSARNNGATKPKTAYVRDQNGQLVHKSGTLHSLEGFETMPFILVDRGSKDNRSFTAYDAASGFEIGEWRGDKKNALAQVQSILESESNRQRWLNEAERVGEITQDAIDDYNNEHEIDTENGKFIDRNDIAGASGSAKFSVYDDIKAKLMARGVPEREIAFIHDYDTPDAKKKLFARVNSGEVRILLGSTEKMGAGTNVQERLVALHHIDAPYRPADLEQREGRIIRQKNKLYERDPDGFEVEIYRYATEQTYDTRRWQILEHKARSIAQLRKYDGSTTEIDDIEGGESANAADMKAAASGDPLILEETQLRNEVRRLTNLRSAHADEVQDASRKAKSSEDYVATYGPRELAEWEALADTAAKNPKPADKERVSFALEGKKITGREGAIDALKKAIVEVRSPTGPVTRTMTYRGVGFTLERNGALVHLDSPSGNMGTWKQDEAISPTGILTRMDNFIGRIDAHIEDTKARIEQSRDRAVALREQSKKSWPLQAELDKAAADQKRVQKQLLLKGPAIPDADKPLLESALDRQRAALRDRGFGAQLDEFIGQSAAVSPSMTQSDAKSGNTVTAMRAALKKAYGNAVFGLETAGLVTLTQTQDEAIAAAADARAKATGESVHGALQSLRASIRRSIRVWHGSPHRGIEQEGFKLNKIGTGEGAQAFGWGAYFASLRDVAEGYSSKLSAPVVTFGGVLARDIPPGRARDLAVWITSNVGVMQASARAAEARRLYRGLSDADRALLPAPSVTDEGQLYSATLPITENDLLDWDKPLSEQPEKVRKALEGVGISKGSLTGHQILQALKNNPHDYLSRTLSGRELTQAMIYPDRGASMFLQSIGIPGLRYLDGGSRADGDGSRNYVIWDESLMTPEAANIEAHFSKNGTIQGFYEPASGQSFLIADGIAKGNESGVLAHEIGIHWANDTTDPKGQKAMQRVLDGAQALVENNRSPFMDRVRARMKDAGETSAEEAAAYIAETYENDRAKAPGSVKQWIKDTLAAIRAWLLTKGVKLARLTPADIAAIARANVRRAARDGVPSGRAVRESDAPYETDLFGNPLPDAGRGAQAAKPKGTRVRRDVQPAAAVPGDTPTPAGTYTVRTIVGKETQRKLGASRIQSFADLAQATQYLYRSAVERFDGIVTDKNGKPLAVVGGFKGAIDSSSVPPETVVAEVVRVPGAAQVWFSHNHPSGMEDVSRADRAVADKLETLLRGSGIESMGLIAIGDGKFSSTSGERGAVPAAGKSVTIPVIEREMVRDNVPRETITGTSLALKVAKDAYKREGGPGLILMDTRHNVIGWMPIPDAMLGKLRHTGQLNAIYRSISEGNVAAVIAVHAGELDAPHPSAMAVTIGQNILAAFDAVSVRALDSINVSTEESAAQRGQYLAAGPVYSRATDTELRAMVGQYANEDGAPTEDEIRAAVKDYRDTEKRIGGEDAFRKARSEGKTKLNYRQWVQVRTKHFKQWFGPWDTDPASASKVVDPETGEPMVLYHGTKAGFAEFRIGSEGIGIHFGSATAASEVFDSTSRDKGGAERIVPAYLAIRNPIRLPDMGHWEPSKVAGAIQKAAPAVTIPQRSHLGSPFHKAADIVKALEDAGYDGIVYENAIEDAGHDSHAALAPNQIKSATANIGTFGENGDIRFSLPERPGQSFLTSASDVQAAVRQVMAGWNGDKPIVRVVQKPSDIKSSLWDVNAPGAKTAEGWFDGRGTVYLIAGNNRNVGRALEVLAHEAYGHYGIERVVGADEWAKIVSQVKTLRGKSKDGMSEKVWGALQSAERRYGKHDDTSFAKEFLAILAERGVKTGPLSKVLDALRAFIKKVTGYDIAAAKFDGVWKFKAGWDGEAVFTARELLGIVERGRQQVRAGRAGAPLMTPAMASEPTPTFYSAMLESASKAQGLPKAGATVEQWKGWMDGAIRRGEFKQSERDWLGVDAWLDGREKTTVQDFTDFIRANQVQVQDVVLGNTGEVYPKDSYQSPITGEVQSMDYWMSDVPDATRGELEDDLEDVSGDPIPSGIDPKFGEWQLPGGENYRELLLTLPHDPNGTTEARRREIEREIAAMDFDASPEAIARRGALRAEANAISDARNRGEFRSTHFGQPNILAHVRFNERTDAGGKKVLLLEEIQSDWHQAGRNEGYASRALSREKSVARQNDIFARFDAGEITTEQRNTELEQLSAERQSAFDGVPDAPFKSTDAWAMLAFKRMVRWAAENGFDRIAWTTGEQQAARYDLSKQVDRIAITKTGGVWEVDAWKDGESVMMHEAPTDADLANTVGKEIAERAIANGGGDYSGLDLKVGDKGMVGFYDIILPKAVNKWAKPFKAKVGQTRVPTGEHSVKGEQIEADTVAVQSIDITPPMREAALAGLPMFSVPEAINPFSRFTVPPSATMRRGSSATWDAPEPSSLDDMIVKIQDKHIDLKRVLSSIKASGKLVDDSIDPYLREELYHGRTAKRTQDFLRNELEPLLKDMTDANVTIADLEEFLHNRHAKEANDHINRLLEPDDPMMDRGSGIATDDARAYLAGLSKAKRATFDRLAAQVDAINQGTRDLMVDYELESQETVDGWAATFKHYVPLHREDNGAGTAMPIGQGFSVRGRETKARTGSTRAVVDILANIAMQRERIITRGEKNRVGQALFNLSGQNPNKDFWDNGPLRERVLKKGEKYYQVTYAGSVIAEVPTRGEARRLIDFQGGGPEYGIREEVAKDRVVTRINPIWKSKDNVVVTKMRNTDGSIVERAVVFNANNERAMRMARAMKNLDTGELGGIMGASAKVTRYFAAMATQYNPVFGVVNLSRDVQEGLLNLTSTPLNGRQADVAKNVIPALFGIYRDIRRSRKGQVLNSPWGKAWEEFQNLGGQTGYRELFRTSEHRAKSLEHALKLSGNKRKVRALWEASKGWLSDYNEAMENATRVAAFVEAKKVMTPERAASLAKNLTVNFNRKGQWTQQASSLYAFFNAAAQGTGRVAHTLFELKDGKPDFKNVRLSKNGQKVVAGSLILGVTQALALAFAGFDDDDPPEFIRERSLIIPTGGSNYITIPMPLGFNVLPNIGRIMTENALNGFENTSESIIDIASITLDMYNPIGLDATLAQTLTPTPLKPVMDIAVNKDFTGKPIAREDFSSLSPTPGHARRRDTATAWSIALSEFLNKMSGGTDYTPGMFSPTPDQIDYLIGQATGGVGREVSKAAQVAQAPFTDEPLPPYKIPLFGRFYGNTDGPAAQRNRYYRNLTAMNLHNNEITGRRKAGEDVAGYLDKHPEARYAKWARTVDGQITKLRKQRKALEIAGASRDQLRRMDELIADRMRMFNDRVQALRD